MERSASSVLSGQSSSIRDLPRPSATISVSSPVVTLNLRDNIAASMQRPGPHFSALELKTAAFNAAAHCFYVTTGLVPMSKRWVLLKSSSKSRSHIFLYICLRVFYVMYTHQKQTRLIKVLYRKQQHRTKIQQDITMNTMDTSTNRDKSSTSTNYQER